MNILCSKVLNANNPAMTIKNRSSKRFRVWLYHAEVVFAVLLTFACLGHTETIPNKLIDAQGFQADVMASQQIRVDRRVTEEQFIEMATDKHTVVLDARSPARFEQMHIIGARNLAFTDFTEESLKNLIATKDTKILIYCNNNVANSPIAFAPKAPSASLNLSTYTALFTYGYRNVFELGPVVDPAKSKIKFEGSLVKDSAK